MPTRDHHHQVVCRSFGAIADVDCAVGNTPCLTPAADDSGYEIDEAEVIYWGRCPECDAAASAESGGCSLTTQSSPLGHHDTTTLDPE